MDFAYVQFEESLGGEEPAAMADELRVVIQQFLVLQGHVFSQFRIGGVLFSANLAFLHTFARVPFHVDQQLLLFAELLATDFASDRQFSGVNVGVHVARSFVAESLRTVGASVRFFARVQPDVSAEVAFGGERLRTVRTLDHGTVVDQHVLLHVDDADFFVADFADGLSVLHVVYLVVKVERPFAGMRFLAYLAPVQRFLEMLLVEMEVSAFNCVELLCTDLALEPSPMRAHVYFK